jgi:RHS repeat-associated protein
VRKTETGGGGVTTVYVYDAGGTLTAEYSQGLASPETGERYLTEDHLGSTRLVTDGSGAVQQRLDYFPFGQTIPMGASYGNRNLVTGYGAPTSLTLEFTGKERDSETGLDYFGARYFSSAQGRFTTPDWSEKPQPVPYADVKDPQSLNLYAYVRNNPLTNRDLDGHWCIWGIGTTCGGNIPPAMPVPPPAPTNPVFFTADQAGVAAARMNQQKQKQTGAENASSIYTIGPAYTYTNAGSEGNRGPKQHHWGARGAGGGLSKNSDPGRYPIGRRIALASG